jgi:hypothetical protein
MQFSIVRTIITVTATSLLGMTLGGLFGYAAGTIAPQLFEFQLMPKGKIDPVATAAIFGAAGGVFCGGTLGAFAILIQAFVEMKNK